MPESIWSVPENFGYALTADLPRLLIMLHYDVILTHRKALTELYVGHGSACKELGNAFICLSSGPVPWP